MGVLLGNCCSSALWTWKKRSSFSSIFNANYSKPKVVKAVFFDPNQVPPILKQAVKEPVAFMGGMFAGILRLDLNEDPLKEWVARTVEVSAISEEDISENGFEEEEDIPQQIDIE